MQLFISIVKKMQLILSLILFVGLYSCFPPVPEPPVTTTGWGWKLATDPDDVLNFLNGIGSYEHPLGEARIGVIWKENHAEFYIFYHRWTTDVEPGGWGWKLATDPEDVHKFLNGLGAYSHPVKDAQIAALWKGNHRVFYVFYQRPASGESPVGSWGWKLATDASETMDFLNGQGAYNHPVTTARIAALEGESQDEFYIFYQRIVQGEPISNWTWKLATTADDAHNYINGIGTYDHPLKGFDIAALWKGSHARFYIFANKGTKAWLQRPFENERFINGEEVQLHALPTSDHPVDGSKLQWSSSLDGQIGQGAIITTNNLAIGTHTLTVEGYGTSTQTPVCVFADLVSFYQEPPAQAEIDRINADFAINWVDGTGVDENWSTYPVQFDQQSTDPSRIVAYAKLDVLRHQRFAEPLPFGSGNTVYEHLKTHVNTINLRLDCNVSTGGGGQVWLNRNFSVWDGRSSGTPENPDACKNPFPNPTLYPYVNPFYLLLHEGRHCEPDDSGHTSCSGKTNMDPSLENGSGHARAALYTMWVYKYGMFDPTAIKNEAKVIAQSLLENRFCLTPSHSNLKVQFIVDELLQQ